MSFDHKAFPFDAVLFGREVADTLAYSLGSGDGASLHRWCLQNMHRLRDPYEGGPLAPGWDGPEVVRDVQTLADFALTPFYSMEQNFGLGSKWDALAAGCSQEVANCLLGSAFCFGGVVLDPGRMGSYFQSHEQAKATAAVLALSGIEALSAYRSAIPDLCVRSGLGVYVTF